MLCYAGSMKIQTMRNLLGEPAAHSLAPKSATLLPPLTAFAVGPMVRVEQKPVLKDMAQKRAGEAYTTMMAGVAYRSQLLGQ